MDNYRAPDIARLKTDVFRRKVEYSNLIKQKLATARDKKDADLVAEVESELDGPDAVEAGIWVDLFLSYRALEKWADMIVLHDKFPIEVKRSVMIREQLGFALNRLGQREEAVRVLESVLDEQGTSSETCGILGRVYKDLWTNTDAEAEKFKAAGYLDKAIDTYVRGFEADWRDAYPGINAATLLEIKGDEESIALKGEILPVVRYAIQQRLKYAESDYWDYATQLELSVLGNDQVTSYKYLASALSAVRKSWEPKTTKNNLVLIKNARAMRGITEDWLDEIIDSLGNS